MTLIDQIKQLDTKHIWSLLEQYTNVYDLNISLNQDMFNVNINML